MSLRFNGLTKKYRDITALNGFTAELDAGVYALLEPNGAGKTTLISLLSGLITPTCGNITYNGEDTLSMDERFRDILGVMPQTQSYYPGFTAFGFVRYMGEMKGLNRKSAKEKALSLLKAVNLEDVKDKKIGKLSGGMKQRVGLAQSLINDPKILILDEPTAGLDPGERIRFRNLISKVARDMTVIFCTHIVSDVESIAKEVLLLKKGELTAKGKVEELCAEQEGKVWEINADSEGAAAIQEKFPCAVVSRDGKTLLRLISDERPHADAVSRKATLEDVYLSVFGDVSK